MERNLRKANTSKTWSLMLSRSDLTLFLANAIRYLSLK
ncbi:hypothetical protein STRDD13_01161 [Streptococcus sp. DD13]|nr:hypothetical protein STRDD13_01161 [Streptococcus sp. DD13]